VQYIHTYIYAYIYKSIVTYAHLHSSTVAHIHTHTHITWFNASAKPTGRRSPAADRQPYSTDILLSPGALPLARWGRWCYSLSWRRPTTSSSFYRVVACPPPDRVAIYLAFSMDPFTRHAQSRIISGAVFCSQHCGRPRALPSHLHSFSYPCVTHPKCVW